MGPYPTDCIIVLFGVPLERNGTPKAPTQFYRLPPEITQV